MRYYGIDPGKKFGIVLCDLDNNAVSWIEGDREVMKYMTFDNTVFIIEIPVGGDIRISMRAVGYMEGLLSMHNIHPDMIIFQSPMKRKKFMVIAKKYVKSNHACDAMAHLMAYLYENVFDKYTQLIRFLEESHGQ